MLGFMICSDIWFWKKKCILRFMFMLVWFMFITVYHICLWFHSPFLLLSLPNPTAYLTYKYQNTCSRYLGIFINYVMRICMTPYPQPLEIAYTITFPRTAYETVNSDTRYLYLNRHCLLGCSVHARSSNPFRKKIEKGVYIGWMPSRKTEQHCSTLNDNAAWTREHKNVTQ